MISVIIPVYNAERFVEKAVRSACSQDEVSQIILVEDGSTDQSLSTCRNIQRTLNSQIELYQHPEGKNHGAGASRNLGILHAQNSYVAFLDADDFYLPNRFLKDIEILESSKHVDGVYGALGTKIYDESQRKQNRYNITTVKCHIAPNRLFEEMEPIGRKGYFHCDTLTVRRDIFNKVGYFDTTLKLTQDTHMWLKMAAKASLVPGIIDKPIAIRGVHTGNRIRNREQFLYYRPILFENLLKWSKENKISVNRRKHLWNCLNQAYNEYLKNRYENQLSFQMRKISFLFKSVFKYPFISTHRGFYSAFGDLFYY